LFFTPIFGGKSHGNRGFLRIFSETNPLVRGKNASPSLVQRGFLLAAIIADALDSQLYDSVARL